MAKPRSSPTDGQRVCPLSPERPSRAERRRQCSPSQEAQESWSSRCCQPTDAARRSGLPPEREHLVELITTVGWAVRRRSGRRRRRVAGCGEASGERCELSKRSFGPSRLVFPVLLGLLLAVCGGSVGTGSDGKFNGTITIASSTWTGDAILHIANAKETWKSTRLNSSHRCISYAVFCLKKKNKEQKSTNNYNMKKLTSQNI